MPTLASSSAALCLKCPWLTLSSSARAPCVACVASCLKCPLHSLVGTRLMVRGAAFGTAERWWSS